jgi:hypothetical protein
MISTPAANGELLANRPAVTVSLAHLLGPRGILSGTAGAGLRSLRSSPFSEVRITVHSPERAAWRATPESLPDLAQVSNRRLIQPVVPVSALISTIPAPEPIVETQPTKPGLRLGQGPGLPTTPGLGNGNNGSNGQGNGGAVAGSKGGSNGQGNGGAVAGSTSGSNGQGNGGTIDAVGNTAAVVPTALGQVPAVPSTPIPASPAPVLDPAPVTPLASSPSPARERADTVERSWRRLVQEFRHFDDQWTRQWAHTRLRDLHRFFRETPASAKAGKP